MHATGTGGSATVNHLARAYTSCICFSAHLRACSDHAWKPKLKRWNATLALRPFSRTYSSFSANWLKIMI